MTMLLLQVVYCLEVAIEICTRIGPRVTGVVNVLVSPEVREEDFTGVWPDICERIKDVTGKGGEGV